MASNNQGSDGTRERTVQQGRLHTGGGLVAAGSASWLVRSILMVVGFVALVWGLLSVFSLSVERVATGLTVALLAFTGAAVALLLGSFPPGPRRPPPRARPPRPARDLRDALPRGGGHFDRPGNDSQVDGDGLRGVDHRRGRPRGRLRPRGVVPPVPPARPRVLGAPRSHGIRGVRDHGRRRRVPVRPRVLRPVPPGGRGPPCSGGARAPRGPDRGHRRIPASGLDGRADATSPPR